MSTNKDWRKQEEKRRKDHCLDCDNFKPIKAKGRCQNCWHKVKQKTQPRFFLRSLYSHVKQRCTNSNRPEYEKYYKGKLQIDIESFYNKFENDKTFLKLFKEWQDSGFEYKLTPSIDRIDVNGAYTLDNIQFLTHGQNSLKDQETIPVDIYTKNGNYQGSYPSINEACRKHNLIQANAWKVLHGERKTVNEYIIKYTK